MRFSLNFQLLRKRANLSQEDVAEKLGVSRQAVSKWETGEAVPDTEKLIMIGELFDCSIDSLIKGELKENNSSEKNLYNSFMNKFSKGIALGVFLILIGVTILLFILSFVPSPDLKEEYTVVGLAVLMVFVLMATPIFITLGIKRDSICKKVGNLTNIYEESEIEEFNNKFAKTIAFSVSLILIGVIFLIIIYGLHITDNTLLPIAVFMIFITIAVPFLVNIGIQKDKYDMISFNSFHHIPSKEVEEKVGKYSAVIMISATIIYFILGFIFNLWKINWLVYPIGGMICGIIAVLLDKDGN